MAVRTLYDKRILYNLVSYPESYFVYRGRLQVLERIRLLWRAAGQWPWIINGIGAATSSYVSLRARWRKASDHSFTDRNWEGVVDLELCSLLFVVDDSRWEKIEKAFQQMQILSGHVWHLEDWTHSEKHNPQLISLPFMRRQVTILLKPLRAEVCCGDDDVIHALYEHRYLATSGRLEDLL